MIIIFQHLNWCSNSCWLLFNNNKQHHRISIPSYTFVFGQRVHLLLNGGNNFRMVSPTSTLYQPSWSFCTSVVLVMVITATSNYLSLWFTFSFYFDSSQVTCVLQVLVLLQAIDLLPTGSTLWCLLKRCLCHLWLHTPYYIRCKWWWLLYYVVSIATMISILCLLHIALVILFWFQVKSSALDRIYMVMILLQVIVILHDPDYRPV